MKRSGQSNANSFALTVVIPTLGRSVHLRGLLERLQRQVTDFRFEVLVVANIPQQALRNVVNSMGAQGNATFEYLETGRVGVNLARNKGLDRARAAIVLFLDDDALLDNDTFVAAHVERHRELTDAVALGGPYRLTKSSSVWDRAYHEIAHEWLHRHTTSGGRTTQLLGGNLSVKKSQLEKNRWVFDEEVSFGGAETGLCQRIANASGEMYFFGELAIGHAPDMSRAILRRKAFLQGAGARWRTEKLSATPVRFVNEFAAVKIEEDSEMKRARELYKASFEFGWAKAPYAIKNRTAPPSVNLLEFYLFQLLRQRPLRRLRQWHREFYTAVRAAWINGARSKRSSRP